VGKHRLPVPHLGQEWKPPLSRAPRLNLKLIWHLLPQGLLLTPPCIAAAACMREPRRAKTSSSLLRAPSQINPFDSSAPPAEPKFQKREKRDFAATGTGLIASRSRDVDRLAGLASTPPLLRFVSDSLFDSSSAFVFGRFRSSPLLGLGIARDTHQTIQALLDSFSGFGVAAIGFLHMDSLAVMILIQGPQQVLSDGACVPSVQQYIFWRFSYEFSDAS
jgi:hypothetical protein